MTTIAAGPGLQRGPSPRIRQMLEASRERGARQAPNAFLADLADAFERHADRPLRERQARAYADAFDRLPVCLFPEDRLVGMVYHLGEKPDVPNPMEWWPAAQPLAQEEEPNDAELVEMGVHSNGSFPGHITWHWDWMLEKGALGLLEEYRTALENPKDETAADFYQGVIILLEAMLRWNDRHVAALEEALTSAEPGDRTRLEELITICRRVPAQAPRNFHEAVQSYYFQYLAVMRENPYGGNGPGRLDYYLWPYLERDLEAGACTLEEARELIDELFIKIHERVQTGDGWVESIVVGGTHPDGASAVNPLSHMMVESIMALQQTHPSVYVRIPDEAPEDFIDLSVRYQLEGGNLGQFLSDRAIVKAMTSYGMPEEDARMYTCGGCMEIVPQGMNSDMLFTGTHSVPKVLELVLTGGKCLRTGKQLKAVDLPGLPTYSSFEDLYDAFSGELHRHLNIMFRRLDIYSAGMAERRPAYLMSSMIADCLERGREMHDGGARYHDYGIAPLGVQNAGDALYGLKRTVYDGGLCTADEMLAALEANYEGYEELRLQLRALPKFGQQHPGADAMTNRVLGTVCDVYSAYRTRWGGRPKPMVFTFVWGPPTGAALGATADGRSAGKPIAHGLTPQSSSMTEGITAAIRSHASLCLERVAAASTTMWDLDPQWATPETTKAILKTFVQLGGQIYQGNATEVSELVRAKENPQDFPNLFVRVGGFSARFVTLGPELQDEIIARHRHNA